MRPLLALSVLLLASAASAELVDRVAAVVNNDIIPLSEVEQRAAPEMMRAAGQKDPTKRAEVRRELMRQALEQLIGEKLLEAEIRNLNIEVTDQDIDHGIDNVRKLNNMSAEQFEQALRAEGYTTETYRQFMRKHLAKLKLIDLKVRSKVKISDEDLQAEYQRWANMNSGEAEVHARHILVQLPPKAGPKEVEAARKKALSLLEEAKKPGVSFAELAKKKSDGPSAADGGDLGFFKRGLMVPEFDKVAFALKPGEISEPVRTNFGFHIIKVEERRALPLKPFEEMKDEIRQRLLSNQLDKYTEQYVQELRVGAVVEVRI